MAAVLLVDDVVFVRAALRAFLESGGHVVTDCSGGEEASRLMGRGRFDVVVTDICMKDGDGTELIRQTRSRPKPIPIIAMTGGEPRQPQARSASLAMRAGAARVLTKPVTKQVILAAVTETLRP